MTLENECAGYIEELHVLGKSVIYEILCCFLYTHFRVSTCNYGRLVGLHNIKEPEWKLRYKLLLRECVIMHSLNTCTTLCCIIYVFLCT